MCKQGTPTEVPARSVLVRGASEYGDHPNAHRATNDLPCVPALLLADRPVKTPVDIALTAAEHRRGHGAMAVDVTELAVRTGRRVRPQPLGAIHCQDQAPVGGLGLRQPGQHLPQLWCIDVPAVQGFVRSGHSSDQFVPGLPYWFVAALESGRTSWCQILDALRLGPTGDVAEVAADQVRQVVTDLIETGRWKPGDLDIMVVFDAGYDAADGPSPGRTAGGGPGADAHGPCDAQARSGPVDLSAAGKTHAEAEQGVPLRQA